MMTETLTPAAQLTGWLQFPDQAKLDAACVLMRERLHLVERQPDHLVTTFADALDTAATDLPLLSYQPLKHPLTLLAKGAVAGWLDLRFALGTPGAPRDQRFYAGGHQAYRYEQTEEVDHLLPATYRANDGVANAASPFRSVAFAPDGLLCALAGGERFGNRTVCIRRSCALVVHETGALIVVDLEQNAASASVPGLFVDVAYGPDGDHLAVVESLADRAGLLDRYDQRGSASSPQFTKQISLLDATTLQLRWSVAAAGNPQRLKVLPDGSAFVTVGVEQDTVVLRTWSITDGAQLATHVHPWRGARGACTDLALHGTRLVSVTDDAARVFHLGMVTS